MNAQTTEHSLVTIRDIIHRVESSAPDLTDAEKAVAAAWWAGKDAGYLSCSNRVREAVSNTPSNRYHRIRQHVIDAVFAASTKSNCSDEILDWDFPASCMQSSLKR